MWEVMLVRGSFLGPDTLLLALDQRGSTAQRQTVRHQRQEGRLRPESAGWEAGRLQGLRPGWSHLQGSLLCFKPFCSRGLSSSTAAKIIL